MDGAAGGEGTRQALRDRAGRRGLFQAAQAESGGHQAQPQRLRARRTLFEDEQRRADQVLPRDGARRRELGELRGKDLVRCEQIAADAAQLEQIPEEERAPSVTKRLEMLRDAMLFPQEWFVHVRNGKGGRERLSPIIGKNAAQIVERIADTPAEEKVWQHIHTSADIHAYRAEYATAIYKAYAGRSGRSPTTG